MRRVVVAGRSLPWSVNPEHGMCVREQRAKDLGYTDKNW
jgi:hypothetical protein